MIFWAIFGLFVGWLINLLGAALPADGKIWPPRCPQCQTPRSGLQLSGVLAYLRGNLRCPKCGTRISLRWPIVELISGFAYLYLFSILGLSPLLLIATLYTSILILICVTDFEHRLILNVVSYPAIAVAAVLSLVTPGLEFPRGFVGAALGLALTGIIYLGGKLFVLYQARRGRRITEVAFGMGDVKLMIFIGFITGAAGVLQALVLGIVIGGIVALGIILYGVIRRESMLYVPYAYGPYLAIAGWLVMLQNTLSTVASR